MRKHFHLSPRNAADSSHSLVNDKKINDIISKSYKSLPTLLGCPESEYNLLFCIEGDRQFEYFQEQNVE